MWQYQQPVKIIFGNGQLRQLSTIIENLGYQRGLLVCDNFLVENGFVDNILAENSRYIQDYFSNIRPNPTVVNVDACAAKLRDIKADFVVAIGGGSVMDCAKAAASTATTGKSISEYHATGVLLPNSHLPIIAIPTTAGTGAEVTCSAVITNEEKKLKAPILHDNLYPKVALVDPELTYTVPKSVCVGTGLDVLAHAIEGYLSINHQPICDAIAIQSTRLALDNIEAACTTPINKTAKENMAAASVMAGLAFSLPKTGASHACSYVLTNKYGIPHGEACGLTLDYFLRLNAETENGRMHTFAKNIGYSDCYQLCDRIEEIKRAIGARRDLKDLKLTDTDLAVLVENSLHPNLKNSPVVITPDILYRMYKNMI